MLLIQPSQSSCQAEYSSVDLGSAPVKSRIEFKPRSHSEPGEKRFGIKAKYQSLKPRAKGEWEVPHECVQLNKKLGEGQFGQVWKGAILARKGSRTVAIKMLRGMSFKLLEGLITFTSYEQAYYEYLTS